MKPSQVAAALRSIANKVDRSKRPSIILVRREIRRVAEEMQQGQQLNALGETTAGAVRGGRVIVVHYYTNGISVTSTNEVGPLTGDSGNVVLPNGDNVTFHTSLKSLKATEDMTNAALLEALFNAGLIDTDDAGNYIV